MKLRQFVIGIVPFLSLGYMSQAQTVTTLDWKFSAAGNPSAPTTQSPVSVPAQATFTALSKQYNFFPVSEALYGAVSGTWTIGRIGTNEAVLELKLPDLAPVSTVDMTIEITHFVDSGAFFPGTISFDIPNAQFDGRTTVLQQSGSMVGSWFRDTYHWSGVSFSGGEVSLDIMPGAGSGTLFLDEVLFTVTGNLTAVPEPTPLQLAGIGLCVFGLGCWVKRRRD